MWASFSRKPPKFVMKNEFREKILLALNFRCEPYDILKYFCQGLKSAALKHACMWGVEKYKFWLYPIPLIEILRWELNR